MDPRIRHLVQGEIKSLSVFILPGCMMEETGKFARDFKKDVLEGTFVGARMDFA